MQYPAPTVLETIFNPVDFPFLETTSSSGGTSGSYVNYPNAQGIVSFPSGMDVGNNLSFTSATGSDRSISGISSISLIDTTNTTPNDTQTNYCNIYQSGAEMYITNNSPSSVLSFTSDSTTFSNDITVNQHLYLSSSVYMKASSSSGEIDVSGTGLNLQDSGFEINLPSSSDTLTINGNLSCGNITASLLVNSSAIDVSCSSFDVQNSSFAINMPSSSNTLTINSNISCGTISSGNITSPQISNSTAVGSNVQLLSSFPTTNTGTNAGLAVSWNNVGGLGEIDLIGLGQNGCGGFAFYSSNSSNAPVQLLTLFPNASSISNPGATFASGLPVKFNTTPTCPTMASGNSSTSIATTAFVQNAVSSVSSTGFTGTIELANNVEFDPSKASPLNSIGADPVYNLYNALFIYFKTPFGSGKVPTVITTGTYTYISTSSSGIVSNTNFNGFISVNLVVYNGFYVSVSTSSGAMPAQKVYFNNIAALA